MNESSSKSDGSISARGRVILLQRDLELSEFATLIEDLGVPCEQCRLGLPDEAQIANADLIIASAQRLLESAPPHLSRWPLTIAVVQDPSRTLSAHLHRIGVSMILCQPIHPQALRLLLLHSIYHGPERRNRKRTPIGQRVRVGSGLFRCQATLLELSPSGARIQMSRMPEMGSRLRLRLGRDLTLGRPIKLDTRVIRCLADPLGAEGVQVGLSILNAGSLSGTLEKLLVRFADGPATWKAGTLDRSLVETPLRPSPIPAAMNPPDETKCAVDAAERQRPDAVPPIPEHQTEDVSNESARAVLEAAAPDDPIDRRTKTRVPYNRRVVALDEAAARVLVGCDLSPGGMRVVSNSSIAVNDVLKVALHCGTEIEPLVVVARAHRDDGDEGLVLIFEDLDAHQVEHLEKIVASSGPIRTTASTDSLLADTDHSLIVGEMVEAMR